MGYMFHLRKEMPLEERSCLLNFLSFFGLNIALLCFRFCSECKSKVLKAYNILTGDIEGDGEKGCALCYCFPSAPNRNNYQNTSVDELT